MNRLLASIALLSAALIAFQLVLMQVLALVEWYHFAYMVISVALLGFGASGTVLALWRDRLLARYEVLLPALVFITGAGLASVVSVAELAFGGFDSYLIFVDRAQWWMLGATYLLYFIPFFTGALAIGLAFVRHTAQINRLYFANLVGSGSGGLIALLLIAHVPVAYLPPAVAALAILAGIALIEKRPSAGVLAAGTFSVFAVAAFALAPVSLQMSQFKSLSYTLDLPEAEVIHEAPSVYGTVHVVSAPAIRHAPGLSLHFPGEIPVRSALFVNGEWYGPLVGTDPADTLHLYDWMTRSLAYEMAPRRKVMILGASTGSDISHASARGAEAITAVEPNRTVVSLLRDQRPDLNDSLYREPHVEIVEADLRAALAGARGPYDLIVLPDVGAFGGAAGAHAMHEQYHLTVEAFRTMWRLLSAGGAVSVTAWMDYPSRNPLKLLATLVSVLEEEGFEDVSRHLAAIRSWGTVTFVMTRSPLEGAALERIRSFGTRMGFDPLLLPDLEEDERARYNMLEDDAFFGYVDRIVVSEREVLFRDYDFHLYPASDDRPYFSQFLRWRSLPHLTELFGRQAVSFLEVGYLIVVFTFFQISFFAILFILAPLVRIGWRGAERGWTLLYFSALGIGFMFFEIVLIQQFVLYLGEPVFSVAAVIATLLIASGGGSLYSGKLPGGKGSIWRAVALVSVVLLLYALLLPILLQATVALPLLMKAGITLAVLVVPGFLMGLPFPLGLRYLHENASLNVPWAWGINGCLSVMSAALAVIVAVELGFRFVIFAAAAAYAIAAVFTFTDRRT